MTSSHGKYFEMLRVFGGAKAPCVWGGGGMMMMNVTGTIVGRLPPKCTDEGKVTRTPPPQPGVSGILRQLRQSNHRANDSITGVCLSYRQNKNTKKHTHTHTLGSHTRKERKSESRSPRRIKVIKPVWAESFPPQRCGGLWNVKHASSKKHYLNQVVVCTVERKYDLSSSSTRGTALSRHHRHSG